MKQKLIDLIGEQMKKASDNPDMLFAYECSINLIQDIMPDGFPVMMLERSDMADADYDSNALTDEQMEDFAKKMGQCYASEDAFWDDLDAVATRDFNLTKVK